MNELAPIVLFVYNRPWHTEQTLNALMQNELADQSVLYIYADGPKQDATEEQLNKIKEVHNIIISKNWCKQIHIIEADKNKGLADSIVDGVTQIVHHYGKVIVLEDDLVTSKGFLRYMNDALTVYEKEEKVFHISGYMFPVRGKLPESFFYKQTSCWGWATWSDKWNVLECSASSLFQKLKETGKIKYVDIDGTNQFIEQLEANIEGRLRTWAVLWHFSVFLKDGLCLHPRKSLVKNIGLDDSGSNCGLTNKFDVKPVKYISVKKVDIQDFSKVYELLKKFYRPYTGHNFLFASKQKIAAITPSIFKRWIKLIINKNFREEEKDKTRLKKLPRFTETEIIFLNKKIRIADNASFQFISKEIFEQEIYKFICSNPAPYIIDCGANIGIGIIYFKHFYPDAEILAFEPDNKIFDILNQNVKSFGFKNIKMIKKACWNVETTMQFFSEGADGGRLAKDFDTESIIQVETARLRDYLHRKVDFLKIDIEGAESEVMYDIKDLLNNVDRVFVEYHSFVNKEQMLPEMLNLLKAAGFRLHISSPGLVSRSPFIDICTYANMDNQLNIYAYRD